jgi:hypothetical protein
MSGANRRQDLRFEALEDRHLLSVSTDWVIPADLVNDKSQRGDTGPVVNPAVIVVSGNGNSNAASLEAYGGPGDVNLPGFNNVGKSSTGNASVVYLGGGWAITANHVTIANQSMTINPGGVTFGGVNYAVDTTSIRRLHNPGGGLADLKVFKIYGDPHLPAILPSYLPTDPAIAHNQIEPQSGHVYMIGNGFITYPQQLYWEVDVSGNPWVWNEIEEPANPDPEQPPVYASGFELDLNHGIRWGENMIDYPEQFLADVWGFVTQFDHEDYSVNTISDPLTHEAQAVNGDSGGAVFSFVDDKWMLSGIPITISSDFSGQPANTVVFGFQTLFADLSYYRDEILEIAGVMGRNIFYNQSKFDGDDAAANAADDSAIATDKVAYLAGSGLAAPSNVTSYSRGINGIMIDLASSHGTLTQDDFTFKVGNNNTPSSWTAAPAPTQVSVRAGAGEGGSDRVEIIWANGAIINRWLEVIVEGNDAAGGFNSNTGLAVSDVFFFGNRIGDTGTGTPATIFQTTSIDAAQVNASITGSAAITNLRDFNRSGNVTSIDSAIVNANIGTIQRINIGASGPFAPEGADASDGDDGGSALASALVKTTGPSDRSDPPPMRTPIAVRILDEDRSLRERVFAEFAWDHEIGLGSIDGDRLDSAPTEFRLDIGPLGLRELGARQNMLLARGSLSLP